jgi:hypothetical protein
MQKYFASLLKCIRSRGRRKGELHAGGWIRDGSNTRRLCSTGGEGGWPWSSAAEGAGMELSGASIEEGDTPTEGAAPRLASRWRRPLLTASPTAQSGHGSPP